MKHWYNIFRIMYSKNQFIRDVGLFFISTKEERIIHKQYKKNQKILKMDTDKLEQDKVFDHDLAIVAIMKNEGQYLEEWIEYHKLIGFSKFYLYDHDSDDNTKEVLQKYIRESLVEYTFVSTPNSKIHHPQIEMYTDAIVKHKNDCKWMAFIDIDEFIVVESNEINLSSLLDNLMRKYSNVNPVGVAINWLNYGSSNFKKKPDGLVIENYLYRSCDDYYANKNIKTIVNPRCVISGGIHKPILINNTSIINENGNIVNDDCLILNTHNFLRVNHYASKSKEEFEKRVNRGFGGTNSTHLSHDCNDIYDPILEPYTVLIKEAVSKRKDV